MRWRSFDSAPGERCVPALPHIRPTIRIVGWRWLSCLMLYVKVGATPPKFQVLRAKCFYSPLRSATGQQRYSIRWLLLLNVLVVPRHHRGKEITLVAISTSVSTVDSDHKCDEGMELNLLLSIKEESDKTFSVITKHILCENRLFFSCLLCKVHRMVELVLLQVNHWG